MKGKSILLLTAAICLPITLTGCKTTESAFDNECKVGGTAIGAIVGGLAAGLLLSKGEGKIGAALLGAAVGGFVGNQLGGLLDCQDKQAMASATQTAGDAPVGKRIVWASQTASLPAPSFASVPVEVPEPAAVPTTANSATSKTLAVKTAPAPPKTRPQEQVNASPAPQPAAQPKDAQWAVVEPIRSGGQSGMWGWAEPLSAPTTAADGKTCRAVKQVVVEPSGAQHDETVNSCLNEQKQWVVASR